MQFRHDEARLSLGPDQISIIATLHDETVTLLTDQNGPYAFVDRDELSLVVARALMIASSRRVHEPDMIEQMILQRVANAFGKSR